MTYSTITLRAACNACASAPPPAAPMPPPCWAWAGLMIASNAWLIVSAKASAVANSSATTSIRLTSPLSPRSRSRTSLRTSASPFGSAFTTRLFVRMSANTRTCGNSPCRSS